VRLGPNGGERVDGAEIIEGNIGIPGLTRRKAD
jgi:hypothetical protein